MARGWESKSVEMQIEERGQTRHNGPNSLDNAADMRELEILKLSRKRLEFELLRTDNPRLRELRNRALAHIEEQIFAQERVVATSRRD